MGPEEDGAMFLMAAVISMAMQQSPASVQEVPSAYELLDARVDSVVRDYAKERKLRGVLTVAVTGPKELESAVIPVKSKFSKQDTDALVGRIRYTVLPSSRKMVTIIEFSILDTLTVRILPETPTTPSLRNRTEVLRLFQDEATRLRVSDAKLTLLFRVNVWGTAESVDIVQSSDSEELDVVASRIAKRAHFIPCRVEGVTVPCWIRMPFVSVGR
jgi:TonB family protein